MTHPTAPAQAGHNERPMLGLAALSRKQRARPCAAARGSGQAAAAVRGGLSRGRDSAAGLPRETWWHAVYEGRRVASDTELRGLLDTLESLFGEGTAS